VAKPIHQCKCEKCQLEPSQPERETHRQINLLLSRLNEQQRRWYLGLQAQQWGEGSERLLAQISGVDERTIVRGQQELAEELTNRPTERTRLEGGGRFPAEKKTRR
jgi:hypothetical protein